MAAPDNAITLYKEASTEWVLSDPGSKEALLLLELPVECPGCGFHGTLGDLFCDPEDETPNNFWCPQCRLKGWSYV